MIPIWALSHDEAHLGIVSHSTCMHTDVQPSSCHCPQDEFGFGGWEVQGGGPRLLGEGEEPCRSQERGEERLKMPGAHGLSLQ